MESPDHKPPQPAAAKRPTLLNAGMSSAAEPTPSTSMLASLERDGPRQVSASVRHAGRRGKGVVAVLAGVVLCGAAAFYALVPSNDASIASAPSVPSVAATAESAGSKAAADPVAAAAASMPVSAKAPPSNSASSARIELAAANGLAAADSVPEEGANRAPDTGRNPLDKLALTGADATAASAAAAVSTKKKGHDKVAAKSVVGAGTAVASAQGGEAPTPTARTAFRGQMDADTELVAAMMARLDRRGAKPSVLATTSSSITKEDDKALAGMVRECGLKSDLLDARRCHNRVCEKHWGKADACPASRAPKGSLGAGADHGKPG